MPDKWWESVIEKDAPSPAPSATAAARVELAARRALDDRDAARAALEWYDRARAWAESLAAAYGFTLEAVAGAVAALSPNVTWESQLEWTPRVLEAFRVDAEALPGPAYGRNKGKAAAILAGADPLEILGGPKVRAFYAGIMAGGNTAAVCIDRHAWALAYGAGAVDVCLTAKRYRDAAQAYRDATAALVRAFPTLEAELTPARVQALTWVYWRANPEGRF